MKNLIGKTLLALSLALTPLVGCTTLEQKTAVAKPCNLDENEVRAKVAELPDEMRKRALEGFNYFTQNPNPEIRDTYNNHIKHFFPCTNPYGLTDEQKIYLSYFYPITLKQ